MRMSNLNSKRTTEVAIIAGGSGTRVTEIASGLPKCLLPLGDSTILDKQLDFFKRYGFQVIHLFLGYKAESVIRHLELRKDFSFVFHVEDEPRGSAGELIASLSGLKNDLVVVHGDLFIDFPIDQMLIKIEDPKTISLMTVPKRTDKALPKHLWKEVHYEPIAGRCIMFPSWLNHTVDVNKSNDTRISVSFNFLQAGMFV